MPYTFGSSAQPGKKGALARELHVELRARTGPGHTFPSVRNLCVSPLDRDSKSQDRGPDMQS